MKTKLFRSLLEDVISELEEGTILNYGKKYSMLTISSYKQVYNCMVTLKFDFDVNKSDLNNVKTRRERLRTTRFLQDKINTYLNLMHENCYHPNTRKNHLKIIRSTLNKAEKHYGYLFGRLESMRELQTKVIALDPEQVEMIHNTFPGKELEDTWYYTRLVLYSCMRVSDLINFQTREDEDYVTIITKKGLGSISNFFLPKDVKEFVSRKGSFGFTREVFRKRLKDLLRVYPEFHQKKIVYHYDHDGNPVNSERFLWDLITPHKLRSSGITYHLAKGLTEMEVRNISGHSNGSTAFYRYVKASNFESLEKQKRNYELSLEKK